MREKPVRACLCFPRAFKDLLLLARSHNWLAVEEITDSTGCGGGCGICRPYLEKMLATGETEFEVIDLAGK